MNKVFYGLRDALSDGVEWNIEVLEICVDECGTCKEMIMSDGEDDVVVIGNNLKYQNASEPFYTKFSQKCDFFGI